MSNELDKVEVISVQSSRPITVISDTSITSDDTVRYMYPAENDGTSIVCAENSKTQEICSLTTSVTERCPVTWDSFPKKFVKKFSLTDSKTPSPKKKVNNWLEKQPVRKETSSIIAHHDFRKEFSISPCNTSPLNHLISTLSGSPSTGKSEVSEKHNVYYINTSESNISPARNKFEIVDSTNKHQKEKSFSPINYLNRECLNIFVNNSRNDDKKIVYPLKKRHYSLPKETDENQSNVVGESLPQTKKDMPLSPESQQKKELCSYLQLMNMNPMDKKEVKLSQARRSTRVKNLILLTEKKNLEKQLRSETKDSEENSPKEFSESNSDYEDHKMPCQKSFSELCVSVEELPPSLYENSVTEIDSNSLGTEFNFVANIPEDVLKENKDFDSFMDDFIANDTKLSAKVKENKNAIKEDEETALENINSPREQKKSVGETKKLVEENKEPFEEIRKTVQVNKKPPREYKKSVQETKKLVKENKKPVEENGEINKKTHRERKKSIQENKNKKPAQKNTKPVQEKRKSIEQNKTGEAKKKTFEQQKSNKGKERPLGVNKASCAEQRADSISSPSSSTSKRQLWETIHSLFGRSRRNRMVNKIATPKRGRPRKINGINKNNVLDRSVVSAGKKTKNLRGINKQKKVNTKRKMIWKGRTRAAGKKLNRRKEVRKMTRKSAKKDIDLYQSDMDQFLKKREQMLSKTQEAQKSLNALHNREIIAGDENQNMRGTMKNVTSNGHSIIGDTAFSQKQRINRKSSGVPLFSGFNKTDIANSRIAKLKVCSRLEALTHLVESMDYEEVPEELQYREVLLVSNETVDIQDAIVEINVNSQEEDQLNEVEEYATEVIEHTRIPQLIDSCLIPLENSEFIPLNLQIRAKSLHRNLIQHKSPKRLVDLTVSSTESCLPSWESCPNVIRRDKRSSLSHSISISSDNGDIIKAYYANCNLIIAQELTVSFWMQSALGSVLGAQNMWIPKGGVDRLVLDNGCVSKDTGEMVMSLEDSVAYIELWTKEHKSDKRERPVADVFASVYFWKQRQNGIYRKVLQLENIKGYASDVQYIVLARSRNIIVSWHVVTEDIQTTIVHCYHLAADYQTVATTREFQTVDNYVSSLHNIEDCDNMVMGCGENKITLWNIDFGYVVASVDLLEADMTPLMNAPSVLWAKCDRGFLFVLQRWGNTEKLCLVAVNGISQAWKRLQTYLPSQRCKSLRGVCIENGILVACYENSMIAWNVETGELIGEEGPLEAICVPSEKHVIIIANEQVYVRHALAYLIMNYDT